MAVTVAEILHLPIMQYGVVVAGRQGLGGNIRWIHVSELRDITRLLKGGELLLTTGMGLSIPSEQQAKYVHELAERKVSALAISLPAWGRDIPPAMVAAADEANLPLIALTREVPFVQITEEVHTLIVNRHYAQFRQAEIVAQQLNRVALQQQNAGEILRILYQVLKNPVACVSFDDKGLTDATGGNPVDGEPDLSEGDEGALRSFYPPGDWGHTLVAELAEHDLLAHASDTPAADGSVRDDAAAVSIPIRLGRRTVEAWLQPIVVSGERWGYLAVIQSNGTLTDVERLVVDRASVTLAYEILRRRSLRQQRQGTLSELAHGLLSGQIGDTNQIYQRARSLGHDLENRWFAAGVVQGPRGAKQPEIERHTANVCSRLALGYLATWKAGRIYLILYGPNATRLRVQLEALAKELEASIWRAFGGESPEVSSRPVIGFGRVLYGPQELEQSRKQAEFTLALRRKDPSRKIGSFFDATGVHRLFVSGLDPMELHRFVREELGPLLHLGETERAELLNTLRVLLDRNLSMANAARILSLSRPTIYQRRTHLEELLQCDLAEPERFISLGLALRALEAESFSVFRSLAKSESQNP